jgi:hypothetical protein
VTPNPPGRAREARRSAAVSAAIVLVIAGLALLLVRSIVHGLAAFPDLRLPVLGAASATPEPAPPDLTPEVRGRVLDANGDAVPGASVRLVTAAPPEATLRELNADAAGAFSFPHLSPMAVRVAADHDPEGAVTSRELAVVAGQSQELTLVLAPSAVRGDVVEGHGHPVVGASLALEGAPWFRRTATSDDAGAFRIGAVPEEATTLVVTARGYAMARVDVTRTPGQAELVVHVRLLSAPSVQGDVLDAEGTPVHARVLACANQATEARTESADDGTFELPASAIGCDVIAEREEFSPSDPVTIVAGRRLTLRLKAPGAIEGVVVDDRGRGLPAFSVSIEAFASGLNGRSGHSGPTNYVDPRGAFRIEKLEPGHYVLMASAPASTPTRSEAIEVRGGATTSGVRIVLATGGSIAGHVYDEHHAPLAGVDVRFDASSTTIENPANGKTDETGAYRIDGAPSGPFTLRAQKEGYRVLLVSALRVEPKAIATQDLVLHGVGADGGPGLEFGGIGANVNQTPEGVAVGSLGPGDPAERAGLRVGDRILRVDAEEAEGMSLTDVIQRLRGPAGSAVAVTVQRGDETVDILIPRGTIVR